MRERFAAAGQFGEAEFGAGAGAVLAAVARGAERYVARGGVRAAPVVHGDPWFANALVTGANELKLLDMRGLVGGREALAGDANYDLAKVAQSLLGFDEAVFALPRVEPAYRLRLVREFVARVRRGAEERAAAAAEGAGAAAGAAAGAGAQAAGAAEGARAGAGAAPAAVAAASADPGGEAARGVLAVAVCLMCGAMHAYEEPATRQALWRLVSGLAMPAPGSEAEALVEAFA